MKLRRLHRALGIALFVLIANAAVTGLLRANARWWYWKDRPPRQLAARLSPPDVGLREVFAAVPERSIRWVELTSLAGKTVYLVEYQSQKPSSVLVDASSGAILSPLNKELAVEIARAFVDPGERVLRTEALPSYTPRQGSSPHPAWRVLFGDAAQTEVFVDRDTGAMLTVLDRGRRFGLWVVKLHELDFAGGSRAALTCLGVGVLLMTMTGVTLAIRGRSHPAARHTASDVPR